jgi:putative membrane protein
MSGLLTLTLIALLAAPVAPQEMDAPKPSSDSDFIVKAADAGLKAVQISLVAMLKASNEDVKWFARRLVTDHSIANDDLLRMSKSRNVTLKSDPTAPMKADSPTSSSTTVAPPETPAAYATLMSLQGAAFDKAYVGQMLKDQQEVFDLFKSQEDDGKDEEVRDWAGAKLLALKDHLRLAKDLQEKLGK